MRWLLRGRRAARSCAGSWARPTTRSWPWTRPGSTGETSSPPWPRTASGSLLITLRTRRFAEEDLARARTDAIDAVGIARFAAQKRPAPTAVSEQGTNELRALVRHRDGLIQTFGDAQRKLHRLVDLGLPEFTRS